MSQVLTRFAAVVLMSFLCSQSFGGVIGGEVIINPFANPTLFPAQFDGETLSTVASSSSLDFLGILVPQSNTTGIISVSDVEASGPAVSLGELVVQQTTGGGFSLTDDSNNVLLSGNFESGLLSGTGANTANFRTDNALFNGGSLLEFVEPEGSFSLGLVIDGPGLQVVNIVNNSGELLPFAADFTGQILVQGIESDGQVPEPSSVLMFSPILLMGLISRRRTRKV